MKFLGMEFFKSEKQKELEQLAVQEKKLNIELLQKRLEPKKGLIEEFMDTPIKIKTGLDRPFRNIKLVNDTLTIVLHTGDVLSKRNATKEDFLNARKATSEQELINITSDVEIVKERKAIEKEVNEKKAVIDGIELLKNLKDFKVENNSVYMKGLDGKVIERSLPQLLVNKFCSFLGIHGGLLVDKESEYQALKKFWLKCCLNPNAQSAEDLYAFLNKHHFKIDKHGNFYAYRRVVSRTGENKALVDFVSNTYTKVKAVWKKKASDYFVWQDHQTNDFSFTKGDTRDGIYKFHGNLEDLYLDLPNMQKHNYTDNHTKKFDYKIGELISMPRNEGDDDNSVSCSKGYHAANATFDYSSFGDTPILMIINPMDVLAVPHENVGKLRTCRWFFACVLDNKEQHILDEDQFDVTDLGDIFEEKCAINLEEYVKNGITEEIKRHTFTIPSITAKEISSIVYSLDEMRKAISNRIVQLDIKY